VIAPRARFGAAEFFAIVLSRAGRPDGDGGIRLPHEERGIAANNAMVRTLGAGVR